ncbi:hypothetical protein TNCV_1040431 [Trichonephila clavipes]|nr:hypothetical protein TNCV_1040431 [Trichonephila clavipes]
MRDNLTKVPEKVKSAVVQRNSVDMARQLYHARSLHGLFLTLWLCPVSCFLPSCSSDHHQLDIQIQQQDMSIDIVYGRRYIPAKRLCLQQERFHRHHSALRSQVPPPNPICPRLNLQYFLVDLSFVMSVMSLLWSDSSL